jgi:DNA helicase-4
VGVVLGWKEDQIEALWDESGEVLSVFPESITEVLGGLDPSQVAMVNHHGERFLGISNGEFERLTTLMPGVGRGSIRLKHSIVLHLRKNGAGRQAPLPPKSFWAFDAWCGNPAHARLPKLVGALNRNFARILKRQIAQGSLRQCDCAAQRMLSFEGHQRYTSIKSELVLREAQDAHLSKEQRLAVASTTIPTLVTARAGTGKTTTLVARACSLIKDLGVAPEEILILAFNNKAAREITERLEQQFPGKPIPTALTFHALAYQIVKPDRSRLLHDENKRDGEKKLSRFIEDTIRENWNPHFAACIKNILSESAHEHWLENGLSNAPDEQYLRYRLKLPGYTMRGERVKSFGEKVIADFYTRHALDYHYEKGVKWGDRWYFPDFTLLHEGRMLIHEHWGISTRPGNRAVPMDWTQSHAEYRTDMERKRAFCRDQGISLLETSIDDLRDGRDAFEQALSRKLEDLGISHHPLSDKDLLKLIVPLQKNRIRNTFATFIDRMKSGGHTLESIWTRIRACHPDPTTEAFLNICSLIYTQYQRRLEQKQQFDFSDLLDRAHERLCGTDPSRAIIRNQKYRVDLTTLRYVMIDEFQDFNLQFSNLMSAVKAMNPHVNVFCVGDDWQAINGFMGADTSHFYDFRDGKPRAMNLSLALTRRCPRSHVTHANTLMKNMGGISAQPVKDDSTTPLKIERVPENMNLLSRKVAEVIKDFGRQRSYAVLFRTNTFAGREIEELQRKVAVEYTEQTGEAWKLDGLAIQLRMSTVHGFKGKEADVVVLADATAFSYPMIHPDGVFFEAFGDTPLKVIQDERRLFYVALTRSKEHLRILYDDKIGPSPFLEEAGLVPPKSRTDVIPNRASFRRSEVPF